MKSNDIVAGVCFLLFCFSTVHAYQNFHGCALAPDNTSGWVVTLDSMIILKTTDGGAQWTEQANPGDRKFFDVTCFGSQDAWTCGILGQILYTSNSGGNWTIQMPGGSAKYATRVEFIDAAHGWTVCGDGVVLRTTDGGAYWEANFTPFIFLPELYGVSFVDSMRGWIVSGWPDSIAVGQAVIARSTDGGIIWDSLFLCSNYDDYFDVHFFDAQNGIVCGGDEQDYSAIIIRSSNGGVTWTPTSVPAGAFYLRAIDFVGGKGWAVGRFGTIIHSDDYGQTWTFQTNPATTTLFDVDFSDTLHGLACGYGIILYTTDGGNTWHDGTGIEEGNAHGTGNGKVRLDVFPNPFRGNLKINFEFRISNFEMSLKIFDVSGRLVRQWDCETMKLSNEIVWSGTDDNGRVVPDGVYFVQLTGCDNAVTAKVILKR